MFHFGIVRNFVFVSERVLCIKNQTRERLVEVRHGGAPRSSFLVQNCFAYPGFFIPYEVEYCSLEELCWDFDGDCIESID